MELTEAYALGLLADLEVSVPRLMRKLEQGRQRAATVDVELSNLLRRADQTRQAIEDGESNITRTGASITEHNMRIATLHQECAALRKRSEELKTEMERVGPGAIHRRLRRERAKLSVQTEDREEEIGRLRAEVEEQRSRLQSIEGKLDGDRDRLRVVVQELDKMQSSLPDPYLYAEIFQARAARAHCVFFLDRNVSPWVSEMHEGDRLHGNPASRT